MNKKNLENGVQKELVNGKKEFLNKLKTQHNQKYAHNNKLFKKI